MPVFWLATTDHDLDEISHVSVLRARWVAAETWPRQPRGLPDAPVGTVTFGPEIEPLLKPPRDSLGDSEVTNFLREAYRPGENFGSAFARLFSRLFADWGVILLDASDPELHRIAAPDLQCGDRARRGTR